jgi:sec-independent protein translocase protein TatA
MFGIGMPELLIILVIALLIFGPKKFQSLGSSLGQTVRNFKQSMEEPERKDERNISQGDEKRIESTK